ncbi:ribonuclease BN (tRNA processing enzyme) [Lipingzhangella halophila]|uniref:Ribonuclease BN (tRNA processing enzyme) n=1 Tax=Lipingzhangella halophila TaxID=1783352 RepID=A0A7W7W3J2_9ACTN|nr:MBL fold metallo-hydrolase [Lipingzhangella halophila]MBB4932836.1 ribonuclease BN (tRNA processing enzyme) [Lipingzhangella halophila]
MIRHTGMEVITLGVAAGPALRTEEAGISTAVVVDGAYYLVDFGLGCTRAAHTAGLRGRDLRAAFVTHLHSDHVAELSAYLLWNWGAAVDGFTSPVAIHGPSADPWTDSGAAGGTERLVGSLFDAFGYDIAIRTSDEGRPPLGGLVSAHDIRTPGDAAAARPVPVYRDDRVEVTAVLVQHPPVFPAYAFRFDTDHGSVTLSGDTAESDTLAALAEGTDLLVHEAVALDYYRDRGFGAAFLHHQERSHTSPDGAGRVAAKSGARRLVLSHLAGVAPDEYWRAAAASMFPGPVTVARSGLRFPVPARKG